MGNRKKIKVKSTSCYCSLMVVEKPFTNSTIVVSTVWMKNSENCLSCNNNGFKKKFYKR